MTIAEKFVTMEYGAAPEDPKEAMTWLDHHQRRFGHFINGVWAQPSTGEYFETADPSTGEKLASVAPRLGSRCLRRSESRAERISHVAVTPSARSSALPLRSGKAGAETLSPIGGP